MGNKCTSPPDEPDKKSRKRRRDASPPHAETMSTSASLSSLPEHDRAILELKRQRDRLSKYGHRLTQVMQEERERAKQLLRQGDRLRASGLVKRRRGQAALLQSVESHLLNVERLCSSLEFATVRNSVFSALQGGQAALQRLNEEVSVEDVERLMDDTAEAVEQQRRVAEMLGEGGQWAAAVSEQEVEDEVRRMEQADSSTQPLQQQDDIKGQETARKQEAEEATMAVSVASLPSPPLPAVAVSAVQPHVPARPSRASAQQQQVVVME